jgi:hypothetical protein
MYGPDTLDVQYREGTGKDEVVHTDPHARSALHADDGAASCACF